VQTDVFGKVGSTLLELVIGQKPERLRNGSRNEHTLNDWYRCRLVGYIFPP